MIVIWCMVPEIGSAMDIIFWYFGPVLPFYPSNNPKNRNFENMKKKPGDIIILHKCTINDSHMMYGSWDMECNGQNFMSFWTVFTLLPHYTHVYHIWQSYDVWFLRYEAWWTEVFFILDNSLPFYSPKNPKN